MARHINKHHIWWPKSRYQTDLERTFRELPCHIVELAVPLHDLLHECSDPPRKPQSFEMVKIIRNHEMGRCPCRVIGLEAERRKRRG